MGFFDFGALFLFFLGSCFALSKSCLVGVLSLIVLIIKDLYSDDR